MNQNRNREIEELRAKQENTVFPDTGRNSKNVDAYFLLGNPNAPLVQRVGAWIFGAFFLLSGVVFGDVALRDHAWGVAIYSIVGFLLGGRIMLSGFRGFRWHKTRKHRGK